MPLTIHPPCQTLRRQTTSRLFAGVILLAVLPMTALPSAAAQPPAQEMPTVEEILRGASPGQRRPQPRPAAPVAPAAQPLPGIGTLPTMEQIVDSAKASAAARAKPPVISCSRPDAPGPVPDGNLAGSDEMVAAQARFKTFVAAGQTFQSCLDGAQKQAWDSLTVAEFMALEQLYQQMQALLEIEAARFNSQIRLYNARTAAAKPPASGQ